MNTRVLTSPYDKLFLQRKLNTTGGVEETDEKNAFFGPFIKFGDGAFGPNGAGLDGVTPENQGGGFFKAALDRMRPSKFLGPKIILEWGRHESDEGVYNFSKVDRLVERLLSENKKLIIGIAWKNFARKGGAADILPPYLRETNGTYVPTGLNPDLTEKLTYTKWRYAFAMKNGDSVITGYSWKHWEPRIQQRAIAFMQEVARRYDGAGVLAHVTFNETTVANPAMPFNLQNSSIEACQDAMIVINKGAARFFVKTPFLFTATHTRPFANRVINDVIVPEKMGMAGPNCNLGFALNATPAQSGGTPGVLYLAEQGALDDHAYAYEIQGDDFNDTYGIDTNFIPDGRPQPPNALGVTRANRNYPTINPPAGYATGYVHNGVNYGGCQYLIDRVLGTAAGQLDCRWLIVQWVIPFINGGVLNQAGDHSSDNPNWGRNVPSFFRYVDLHRTNAQVGCNKSRPLIL